MADDRYRPLMCAECASWLSDYVREDGGIAGYCPVVKGKTYHVDWCHTEEEREAHKEAMEKYQRSLNHPTEAEIRERRENRKREGGKFIK